MAASLTLARVVAILRKFYGIPEPPPVTDPFEQILWENVAYLADDQKRGRAFSALRKTVGTSPEDILKAKPEKLLGVTRMGGIVPELRAQRLRQCAEIVQILRKGSWTKCSTSRWRKRRRRCGVFPPSVSRARKRS